MAIDFLILGLLLVSFIINLLALGAFWVMPGLRTTANRFTINLLVVNLIACLTLAPTLFLSSSTGFNDSLQSATLKDSTEIGRDDTMEFYSKLVNHQMAIRHNGIAMNQEAVILRRSFNNNNSNNNNKNNSHSDSRTIELFYKCNSTFCQELTIDESDSNIIITEFKEENYQSVVPENLEQQTVFGPAISDKLHFWTCDIIAALSTLAVLLVVGDTWCAVTDPLRYHISSVRAGIFIGITWLTAILFGSLSALLEIDVEESKLVVSKHNRIATTYSEIHFNLFSSKDIFGVVLASLYFFIVILLPFVMVCCMYWRIYSEARENGIRMRQNGSSPLLQSALHLGNQRASGLLYSNSFKLRNSISSVSSQYSGGLQMQIDQPRDMLDCSQCSAALPTRSDLDLHNIAAGNNITAKRVSDASHIHYPQKQKIRMGAAKEKQSRKFLCTSTLDIRNTKLLQDMRQIHSSPNLQKYMQVQQDSFSDEVNTAHLLRQQQPHHVKLKCHQCPNHIPFSHSMQIPNIHMSPKALSYMSSLRHRLSNASSLFKYREESRIARVSVFVLIMFLISYLPYGLLVLLKSTTNYRFSYPIGIFMLLLGTLCSPFIFAFRNKRVRHGVKRLFACSDRVPQRQTSIGIPGIGFLHRHNGDTKGSRSIQRNGSKISTYSAPFNNYLTPQRSMLSIEELPAMPATLQYGSQFII